MRPGPPYSAGMVGAEQAELAHLAEDARVGRSRCGTPRARAARACPGSTRAPRRAPCARPRVSCWSSSSGSSQWNAGLGLGHSMFSCVRRSAGDDRGGLDLDLGAVFHQRRHLDRRHGDVVVADELAKRRADRPARGEVLALVVTYQVMRTMCSGWPPPSRSTAAMLASACRACSAKSSLVEAPSGVQPTCRRRRPAGRSRRRRWRSPSAAASPREGALRCLSSSLLLRSVPAACALSRSRPMMSCCTSLAPS